MTKIPERTDILDALAKAHGPLTVRDLARRLKVDTHAYRAFRRRLRAMERDGEVFRQRQGRYALPGSFQIVVGTLDVTRAGDGFVVPEEAGGDDVFVPRRYLGSAVEGDRVAVRVEKHTPGRNPEGRLVRVLDRAWSQVVGVYHDRKGYGVVVPQEPSLPADIFVPAAVREDASDGDIVLVELSEWGKDELRPVGSVTSVLGRVGDPGLDVLAIILGQQLPIDFPPDVAREASKIARRGVRREDLTGREDFRDVLCFTIDPADAKDHDDAISVRRTDGGMEVGIHIADVSWYVKEGSSIDREALERGTSVYLVDRVIPMLPEELSSSLCSLVPGEDRLTLSVVLSLDERKVIRDRRVVRSVIRSAHRLAYEEAQDLLDDSARAAGQEELARALSDLSSMAKRLREARVSAGAIDFAIPEAEVVLDDGGRPLEIRPRPRLETHRIVEDLMILANETVARLGLGQDLPLIYRIHEEPDPDRLQNLRELAAFFGQSLPAGTVRPADLARLVREATGRPHEYLISTVTLRSMRRARYSTTNVGHFGLASEAYVHFTSPIRRYPDLSVHRAVVRWLNASSARADRNVLTEVARHSSAMERRAQEAERESVDAKKIQYMQRHVGDEFSGTISGVTSFGLFVTLDQVMVEGLVRLGSLVDDYYMFDPDAHSVLGRRTRTRYRLGDRITVQVVRVDTEARTIDLELEENAA